MSLTSDKADQRGYSIPIISHLIDTDRSGTVFDFRFIEIHRNEKDTTPGHDLPGIESELTRSAHDKHRSLHTLTSLKSLESVFEPNDSARKPRHTVDCKSIDI
jgi:hypothetical protein